MNNTIIVNYYPFQYQW